MLLHKLHKYKYSGNIILDCALNTTRCWIDELDTEAVLDVTGYILEA